MGKLGYGAVNVGERDLAFGYDEFQRRAGHATFPFVSSNVVRRDDGEPIFKPYVILDVDRGGEKPIRVGVLGIARFNPIFLKAGPGESNMVIDHPEKAIGRYIGEVREKSDVVVLLAALHRSDARDLVAKIPGIDLVIGSYGGIYTIREEKEGSTWLFYSGNQGKRLGESRLFLGDPGEILSVVSYMHFLSPRYPVNEEWEAYVLDALKEARDVASANRAASAPGAQSSTAGH